MLKIDIYTDGSCIKNPGPGGCAAILKFLNKEIILSAGYYYTTNNRMELMAVIISLDFIFYYLININYFINIFTDSNYLYKGINNWIYLWKKNNWKNNNNKLIKNIDLWFFLNKKISFFKKKINWFLIKSHSGNIYNEKCDRTAFLCAKNPTMNDFFFYYFKII